MVLFKFNTLILYFLLLPIDQANGIKLGPGAPNPSPSAGGGQGLTSSGSGCC